MSVKEINVYGIADMTGALQGAQDGDIYNFYIRNDMYFSSAVMFSRAIVVNLINANGSHVILTTLGAYRHFSTGTAGNVTGLTVIIGPNIMLDGMGAGGGVLIYGNNCSLTLDSCVITNCMNPGNGGGVLIQGNQSRSRLIMNDAYIDRCKAGSGGGVFGAGCDIEVNGGQIVGNTAINSGGGITAIAGGNRLGSTLVIAGAKVSGNNASAGYASGGGINAFDTIAMIRCSEISYNLADDYGSGIYSFAQLLGSDHNQLTMINSQVMGNMTRNTGGGIGLQGNFGKFEIGNCRIARNRASSEVFGTNQGGGIYFAGASTLRLEDGQAAARVQVLLPQAQPM